MRRAEPASLLAALIAPVRLDQFLRDFWSRQPLFSHGPVKRLAALTALPELRSVHALIEAWRSEQNLYELRPAPRRRRAGGADQDQLSPARAARRYAANKTLYFHGVEDHVPALRALLLAIDADLGVRPGSTSCLAFASRVGAGAPPHFDPMHVFNVQLQGTKRWELARNPVAHPSYTSIAGVLEDNTACKMPPADWRVTARPGSVVFFPHGTWHRTLAGEESFAVAFIVNSRPWGRRILDHVWDVLAEDPEERRLSVFLSHRTPRARLARRLGATRAKVTAILGGLGVDQLLSAVPDYAAAFELPRGVAIADDRDEAHLGTRRVPLAADAARVLRWAVARGDRFTQRALLLALPDVPFARLAAALHALRAARLLRTVPRGRRG